MKRRKSILWAALVIIAVGLTTCKAQETNVSIKGKLTNVPDSLYLYIVEFDNQRGSTTARGVMTKGELSFEFKTRINTPHLATIRNHEIGFKPLHLMWIEPGAQVRITGDGLDYSTWKIESNVKAQQNENRFREATQEEESKRHQLNVEICRLEALYGKAQNQQEIKKKLIEFSKQSDSIFYATKERVLSLLEELPVDEAWMLRLFDNSQTREMSPHRRKNLIALSQRMSEEQKSSYFGKAIMTNLNPPQTVAIGQEMPDIVLKDTLGNLHRLQELRGKYLLLDFWSSGCAPCIKSLPELKEIADVFKDNLTIVGISSDPEKAWKRASRKYSLAGYNWNDMQGTNGIFTRYGIEGTPTYLLFSPDGKLIGKETGYKYGLLFKFVKETIAEHKKTNANEELKKHDKC